MAGDMQLKLQLNLDSKQYTAALLAAGQQVQQFSGQLQTADTAAQAMANALRAAATARSISCFFTPGSILLNRPR